MLHIANPIYDSVFKYLLEDERIAKTLLGALIKSEIIDIQMRPNEYANTTKDNIAMFRIDFNATVRNADGSKKLILIELQKTWVETETLRFRQYLGAQYANPANMQHDSRNRYGLHIITIYIMGHRVGDINVPVLYVGRNFRDYDGNDVTQGIPDPFVDSLTHDSIVVQIPLLKGQKNNRLEKYLDIFCQDRKEKDNSQILSVDDSMMDDDDMRRIVTRLLSAASDTQVRHSMNIEEEINTALENRDTEIMHYKKKASDAEKKASVAERKASDAERKASDAERKASDAERKASDAERKASDAERKASDAERKASDAEKKASDAEKVIDEQNMQLSKKTEQLSIKDSQLLSAVKLLHDNGMSNITIAASLGISPDDIGGMLSAVDNAQRLP